MNDIRDVSDELFSDLLRKEKKFIVLEFWSPGCSVCKDVEPELVKAKKDLGADTMFMRVNTDHNNKLATKYHVTGTPTFLFFCKGQKVGGTIGYVNATVLRNTVKDLIRHSISCPPGKRPSYEMDGYG
ncbi:MAG TPA: thioredoxin family protein [Methanomassiliicoccales archaeon]|nr:thioredoxin family protein [Methanomassiliicoccales archaeon]